MVAVPAQYETVTEQKLVKEASTQWLIDLQKGSAPASKDLLNAASEHGIDLAAAQPGMCFHEHFLPAKFEQVNAPVLIQEEYEVVTTQPAEFRWVEKTVLVREAGTRIEEMPAQF